jgi:hypothetical protein
VAVPFVYKLVLDTLAAGALPPALAPLVQIFVGAGAGAAGAAPQLAAGVALLALTHSAAKAVAQGLASVNDYMFYRAVQPAVRSAGAAALETLLLLPLSFHLASKTGAAHALAPPDRLVFFSGTVASEGERTFFSSLSPSSRHISSAGAAGAEPRARGVGALTRSMERGMRAMTTVLSRIILQASLPALRRPKPRGTGPGYTAFSFHAHAVLNLLDRPRAPPPCLSRPSARCSCSRKCSNLCSSRASSRGRRARRSLPSRSPPSGCTAPLRLTTSRPPPPSSPLPDKTVTKITKRIEGERPVPCIA